MSDCNKTDPNALLVSDLMTREVVQLDKGANLHRAIQIMVSSGVRHLPVVEHGKPIAVLSDRDVRLKVSELFDPTERRSYLESISVMAHASRPVTTTSPGLPVRDAAQIFVNSRISCLPVVDDDGRLIGIITKTDLCKWLAHLAG
jgi:CBS domain-containing protein